MELELAIKAFADTGNQIAASVNKLLPSLPLRKSFGTANNPSAAATQTLIIPQSPAAGRMWFVHRIVVLGADGHTAVANAVADVYAGPGQEVDATAQIYSGLTLPSIVNEGRHHNPIMHGSQVYVICYNLPANQQVQFAIGIEDYPDYAQLAMEI